MRPAIQKDNEVKYDSFCLFFFVILVLITSISAVFQRNFKDIDGYNSIKFLHFPPGASTSSRSNHYLLGFGTGLS